MGIAAACAGEITAYTVPALRTSLINSLDSLSHDKCKTCDVPEVALKHP